MRSLVIILGLMLGAGTASAATMTYTSGNIVGPTISSSFDISGALPSGALVYQASITANFQDIVNEHYFYQTQWAGANNYNWVYLDPAEKAQLGIGAETFEAASPYHYVRYFSRTEWGTNYFDVVDGYWGDFSVSSLLAQSALDALNTTGVLAFNVSSLVGNFKLLDVTLSYDFANRAIAAVPLPAALPLFATAIGGLGLAGWMRKRKAVATT